MFIQNEYYDKYFEIISEAKSENRIKGDQYYENHHIIPRSLGGGDESENLVLLTIEEHYKCHLLLPFFTEGEDQIKARCAVWNMLTQNKHKILNTMEEYIEEREKYSESISAATKLGMEKIPIEKKIEMRKKQQEFALFFHNDESMEQAREKRNKKISESMKIKWENGDIDRKTIYDNRVFNCFFCGKEITMTSNILQHEKACKMNPNPGHISEELEKYLDKSCQYCGKKIKGARFHLLRHEQTCYKRKENETE